MRASRVACSDETSARVTGRTWWEWAFLGEGAVLHELAPSRTKSMPERGGRGAAGGVGGGPVRLAARSRIQGASVPSLNSQGPLGVCRI